VFFVEGKDTGRQAASGTLSQNFAAPKSETNQLIEPRRATILILLINLGFLVSYFMIALLVFDRLPQQIPVHFGGSGVPDRWAELSYASWLALPLTATGLTLLICLPALFIDRLASRPGLVNLPRKQKGIFELLSINQRKPILQSVEAYLCGLALLSNLLMAFIHFESYRIALRLVTAGQFLSGLFVYLFLLGLMTWGLFKYLAISFKRFKSEAVDT
jgi:Domain of unknown function (DUF1648)